MAEYIPFDPKKHKGRPLYEVQSVDNDDGNMIDSVIVLSDISYDIAQEVPWLYLVEEPDA